MIQFLAHVRYDRLIVWIECVCLVAVLGFYMYFITRSVVEAVVHNTIAYDIQRTEIRVHNLEQAYFEHLDGLTPASLTNYSLVATLPEAYVSVDESKGKLTRRD